MSAERAEGQKCPPRSPRLCASARTSPEKRQLENDEKCGLARFLDVSEQLLEVLVASLHLGEGAPVEKFAAFHHHDGIELLSQLYAPKYP